jgi:hypothetical protein
MNLTGPLTPAHARLIRIHVMLIPVYGWLLLVWTAYAIDISPAGRLDRSGHIKGHDFAHFYVLGEIANDHAADDLYSFTRQAERMDRLVPSYENRFAPIHGPQLSLLFAPLARLPYETALTIWLAFTVAGYAACCFWLWSRSPALKPYGWVVVILAAGFPPFYLLIAFGQNSILALGCVTAAYFALQAKRPWLAGIALGLLAYKPAFGLALPFVLLYGREWRMVLGATLAVVLQLAAGALYYGVSSVNRYVEAITHVSQIVGVLEPIPDQMQSLRSFFSALVPSPDVAFAAYVVSAAIVVAIAAWCWRSTAALELRYSVLLLATILVDPHVNPYDLVAIIPVFVLVAARLISRPDAGWRPWALLYLCYYLPALYYLPTITHIQFSVIALVALTIMLAAIIRTDNRAVGSRVVSSLHT